MMGYNTHMERRSELITGAVDEPDLTLMRAIARGDAHALEELYAIQGPGILAYLISRLGDRQLAEEVLQYLKSPPIGPHASHPQTPG
jgi:predicted RNA polymerase sigma factor